MERKSAFVVGSFVAACSVKVDHLPRPGESMLAQSFTLEAGGKGFNVAVAAHRLGVEVDGVLAIGDDSFATFARAAVAEAGLPASMLVPHPGPTGAGVGFVDAGGENCIAVCPAANALLSADAIRSTEVRLRKASVVVAQFEVSDSPIAEAFASARSGGSTTILNPSPFRAITSDILRGTNIVIVNQIEACALLAQLDPDHGQAGDIDEAGCGQLARRIIDHGIDTLIITLGKEGMVAWTKSGDVFRQPAFSVQTIDTIGAGDACLGGILAALSLGLELKEAMRWGAACGAMATTRSGLLAALPTREQLEVLLSSQVPTRSHPHC